MPTPTRGGDQLEPLAPAAFATPLGMHPNLHLSTFSVRDGDRLLFTDGLLEARDRGSRPGACAQPQDQHGMPGVVGPAGKGVASTARPVAIGPPAC